MALAAARAGPDVEAKQQQPAGHRNSAQSPGLIPPASSCLPLAWLRGHLAHLMAVTYARTTHSSSPAWFSLPTLPSPLLQPRAQSPPSRAPPSSPYHPLLPRLTAVCGSATAATSSANRSTSPQRPHPPPLSPLHYTRPCTHAPPRPAATASAPAAAPPV
jgi:hypothetical protein